MTRKESSQLRRRCKKKFWGNCMTKRKMVYILLFLIFFIFFVFGTFTKEVKPDTLHNVSWLMKLALDDNNYTEFNNFFIEGRKGKISLEEFKKMSDISTAGWEDRSYQLIKFSNGEMLLVYMSPNKIHGKYYIQDIKIVPDDLKDFFEPNK